MGVLSFWKRENDTKSLLISQEIYLHTFPQYQIQDTHNFKKNEKRTTEFIIQGSLHNLTWYPFQQGQEF